MRTSRGSASGLSGVDEKNRRMRNVVGPTTSSVLTICSRNPATIDAMAMTVAIPMTTPRMVSPERSLLTRSWSTAISQPSRIEWNAMLLGAQRFDRVEARRAVRRVNAEYDPHADAESQRHRHRPGRHAGGQGGRHLDQGGERAPREQSGDAAQQGQDGRLGEELAPHVAPRGAQRLEDPDLAGALGHAHQHDVHDHDTAHHDADAHHGRHDRENHPGELAPERDQPFTGVDGEVVLLRGPQVVRDAHRLLGAEHTVGHARGRRHLDRDHRGLAAPVQRLERGERQHDEPVPGLPQHGALLGDDPRDRELRTADADRAAHGALRSAEQLLRHIEPQHRDEPPLPLVHVGERRPGRERVVLHHDERRRDPEHQHVTYRAVTPLHVRHRRRPAGLEGDGVRVGQGAFHVRGVLLTDDRPALDPLQLFVVDEPDLDRVAPDLKRVDPDDRARDALAHVRVHALDHRDDRHEEPDRHDDAEQREERAQLVAPRGLERLHNRFGEEHGAGESNGTGDGGRGTGASVADPSPVPRPPSRYSYLSASTGSNLAALLAGYRPNPMPVRAEAARAAMTDHSGTCAGIGVRLATPNATTPPASIPTAPPTSVRVEASTRNCHWMARRVAPSALRTPISRVRSVTEIIMIATTPTPPTINAMDESTSMTRKNMPVTLFQESSSLSWVTIEKLFSCPGLSPRSERNVATTSSMASCWV